MPSPMERTSIRKSRLFRQFVALERRVQYRKQLYNLWHRLADMSLGCQCSDSNQSLLLVVSGGLS